MPIVRMPDGTNVSFPDEMPREQIRDMIASKFPNAVPAPDPTQPHQLGGMTIPPPPEPEDGFFGGVKRDYQKRLDMGSKIADEYVAGNQSMGETVLQHAGQGAAFAGDIFGSALSATGRVISAITPDPIENKIKDAARAGIDYVVDSPVGRAAGNAANAAIQGYGEFEKEYPRAARNIEATANLGLSLGPFAPIKGKSLAHPAASLAEKGIVGVGKGTAKAASATGRVAADALTPNLDDGLASVAKLAKKYDIPISITQISSSPALKNIEKVSKELPFSGAGGFKDKQLSQWHKGLLNTVGHKGDKITPEVMDGLFKKVGSQFDDIGKGKHFSFDDDFVRRISAIEDDAFGAANADAQKNFHAAVNSILNEVDRSGKISGERLSYHRARINKLARKTSNPDTRELLHDLEGSLIDVMTASNPEAKSVLSEAKKKYKNLLAIEPLAQKAKGGYISPAQLHTRVARIYGREFTRGKAGEIGDLARIGHELLPELGGSDTAQKLLYTAGATGGGVANLPATASVLGGNRLYQSAFNRNQALVSQAIKKSAKKEAQETQRLQMLRLIKDNPLIAPSLSGQLK